MLFILPWAVPSIPTILSVRFMLNPEWGVINQTIFRLTFEDGPNWLNDPQAGAVLRHPRAHLEVAAVLDADPAVRAGWRSRPTSTRPPRSTAPSTWQKFRFVTWPSVKQLYLTCAHPLDDLDARRLQQRLPADRRRSRRPHARARDARHPLSPARRGRPVDGDHRVRAAADPAARLLHDEAALREVSVTRRSMPAPALTRRQTSPGTARSAVSTEAKLLLIGIPLADLDAAADLPPLPVRLLGQGSRPSPAISGRPTRPCAISRSSSARSTTSSTHFWEQLWNSVFIAGMTGLPHAGGRHARGLRHQPPEGARRAHRAEPGAVHLLHPRRVPGGADVPDHGPLRAARTASGR